MSRPRGSRQSGNYEVDYGKPPKEAQFKRGQSGNLRGRPKGTKNLKTDLLEELAESIPVREGERIRTLSKQRAMLKGLMVKALKGDSRAANLLLSLIHRLLDTSASDDASVPLSDDDQHILELLATRAARRVERLGTSEPAAEGQDTPSVGLHE